jgi:Nuclease-related domain
VDLLVGSRPSTEAWGRGAAGEERVGNIVDRAVAASGIVLHDRSLPGTHANIDHLVVVPSGVWVVDTKHYRGRLERRRIGVFGVRSGLFVAGRDVAPLVGAAKRQRARVERALARGVPVRVALCFMGARWTALARPFPVDGVLVTWPAALGRRLRAPGPLGPAERAALAQQLSASFPPYRT